MVLMDQLVLCYPVALGFHSALLVREDPVARVVLQDLVDLAGYLVVLGYQ